MGAIAAGYLIRHYSTRINYLQNTNPEFQILNPERRPLNPFMNRS